MLNLGGEPLLNYWVRQLTFEGSPVQRLVIVTNALYLDQFQTWLTNYQSARLETSNSIPIELICDNTTCNDQRIGAVGDIMLGVSRSGQLPLPCHASELYLEMPWIIIAGDTLFLSDFSLPEICASYQELSSVDKAVSSCLVYHCREDEVPKRAILEVDTTTGEVQSFREKPAALETKSRLACPPFYVLSSAAVEKLLAFCEAKQESPLSERDAPGKFVAWLLEKKVCPLRASHISGRWDVGGLDDYQRCNAFFMVSTDSVN